MNLLFPALATLLALGFSPLDAGAAEETPQSLQKKCDARDWQACFWLAHRHEEGDGVVKDAAKAGALHEKACNAGYGPSCTTLAFLWDGGELGSDKAKVVRLTTRACELKDPGGCYFLGRLYDEGSGVPKDSGRAVKLFEQACKGDEGDACMDLYLIFVNGKGVPKDEARANAFYEKGCDLQAFTCVMGFNLTFEPALEQCNAGNANACKTVGGAHLRGEAYLAVDEAKASEFLEKACNGGVPAACADLGWIHDRGKQTPRNVSKAAGYYDKACAGKNAYGCQMLGFLHLMGDGVPKDARRAADLLRTACNANTPDAAAACAVLAESYANGLGVTKDPARAASLHAQACRLGPKESCAVKPDAAQPAAAGCSVAKVRLGSDTAASVQRDIARRGGSASSGNNNGKPTLSAMSGDYSDSGAGVMSVNYTFESNGPTARLVGVTIVNHASSKPEFDKLLAARKSASAATVGPQCSLRLVPNADTFYIYEIYESK